MRKLAWLPVVSIFAFSGCDDVPDKDDLPDLPSQAEIDDAKARVNLSADAVGQGRIVLELLGFMPKYTCGEARSVFAGKLPTALETSFNGATATLDASNAAEDVILIQFPTAGVSVASHTVTGMLTVRTSGGMDRFALEVDAHQARVDGKSVPAVAGYRSCSDETTYWGQAEGPLGSSGATFRVDLEIAKRAGVPIIGGTTLLINGTGSVTRSGGTDTVTLTNVDYEIGDFLPGAGTVVIETSGGHRISATFDSSTPVAGRVSVKIDARAVVTIPLI